MDAYGVQIHPCFASMGGHRGDVDMELLAADTHFSSQPLDKLVLATVANKAAAAPSSDRAALGVIRTLRLPGACFAALLVHISLCVFVCVYKYSI